MTHCIKNILFQVIILLFIIPNSGISQVEFTSDIEAKIEGIFSVYANNPGAAIGIYGHGKELYKKGFGFANMEYEIPVTEQSVFESGSLAMHITATAILLLEKEGKLSLEDAIQNHLVDFPKYKEGNVTIRHCLHHSSGIRDYLSLLSFSGRDYRIDFDNAAAGKLLQKQKELTIVPGTDYRYSNSNYLILALIVEKVSGQSFGEYCHENIFKPAGMNNTFFYDDKEKVIKNRALVYSQNETEVKLKQNFDFHTCGDGRLYTNVEDMLKWCSMFSNSKIGNQQDFLRKLFSPGELNDGTTMSYARGLEYGDFKGHRLIAHNGWWEGGSAMILIFLDIDLYVVTLGNNGSNNAISKSFQVAEILVEERIETKNPEKKIAPSEISNYVKLSMHEKENICGTFFSYSIGYDRTLFLKNDSLYYRDGDGYEFPLEAISTSEFMVQDGNNLTTIKINSTRPERTMSILYGERPPMILVEYDPLENTENYAHKFVGEYYSSELDITYHLRADNQNLQIFVDEKMVASYHPQMKNLFNSAHDGFIQFEEDPAAKTIGFTMNDYSLGSLSFVKVP